ncbi:MAG: sigma 54-interacting transcriptional regulator, partial [Polyangiales bacterium]
MTPKELDELSTELRPSVDSGSTTTPVFEVTVIEGPDEGTRFALDGTGPARVLLGSSPACAIRLTDRAVSRRHAALHHGGEEVQLTDLGSRNGTFVNGVRVIEAFLRGGDVMRVGASALRLDLVESARKVPISSATRFGKLVGSSVEMRRLYPILERVAGSNVPVVIEGETGTGKELLAESLHEAGSRAGKPFIVFDCTTVAPSLIESELFGHERGAFTGAVATRKGVFELAHGGTLFIDEIGDLPLSLQPKLLRAIQRSEVRRVGGDKWIPVDVRVISATRRDLDAEVQAERFRDDLFFRLAVARVELPPLRAREGDVAVLAHHFWKELGGGDRPLPYDVLQRCEAYSWPGNVRELHNEIARRIALGEVELAARSGAESLPLVGDSIDAVLALDLPLARAREKLLEEFHARYVERVVAQHGGNVTRAAAASGVAHRYFQIL